MLLIISCLLILVPCLHAINVPANCKEAGDKKGLKYRGDASRTAGGLECQKWTSQIPNKHSRTPQKKPNHGLGDHNYCRNPDNEPNGPWCYNSKGTNPRWKYCNIPICGAQQYTVTLTTGTKTWSQTNDDVYVKLVGNSKSSVELLTYGGSSVRNKGSVDTYTFLIPDIGDIRCIHFRQVGTDGWRVEKAEITRKGGPKVVIDMISKWLDNSATANFCIPALEYNVDYWGADIPGAHFQSKGLLDCYNKCKNTPGCKSFTLRRTTNDCWPKSKDYGQSYKTGQNTLVSLNIAFYPELGSCSYIKHSGGKCIHPLNGAYNSKVGTHLVTYDGCEEPRLYFCAKKNGDLQHLTSEHCVVPASHSNASKQNDFLVLGECGQSYSKFSYLKSGSIKHTSSGKCWHPYKGSGTPANDNKVVTHSGCDETRLRFSQHAKKLEADAAAAVKMAALDAAKKAADGAKTALDAAKKAETEAKDAATKAAGAHKTAAKKVLAEKAKAVADAEAAHN